MRNLKRLIFFFQKYTVTLNPQKIFPASLLLIDDYINANRSKGLICCLSILRCVVCNNEINGNQITAC